MYVAFQPKGWVATLPAEPSASAVTRTLGAKHRRGGGAVRSLRSGMSCPSASCLQDLEASFRGYSPGRPFPGPAAAGLGVCGGGDRGTSAPLLLGRQARSSARSRGRLRAAPRVGARLQLPVEARGAAPLLRGAPRSPFPAAAPRLSLAGFTPSFSSLSHPGLGPACTLARSAARYAPAEGPHPGSRCYPADHGAVLPHRFPALHSPAGSRAPASGPESSSPSNFRCHKETPHFPCRGVCRAGFYVWLVGCFFFLECARPLLCDEELLPNKKCNELEPWDVVLVSWYLFPKTIIKCSCLTNHHLHHLLFY